MYVINNVYGKHFEKINILVENYDLTSNLKQQL